MKNILFILSFLFTSFLAISQPKNTYPFGTEIDLNKLFADPHYDEKGRVIGYSIANIQKVYILYDNDNNIVEKGILYNEYYKKADTISVSTYTYQNNKLLSSQTKYKGRISKSKYDYSVTKEINVYIENIDSYNMDTVRMHRVIFLNNDSRIDSVYNYIDTPSGKENIEIQYYTYNNRGQIIHLDGRFGYSISDRENSVPEILSMINCTYVLELQELIESDKDGIFNSEVKRMLWGITTDEDRQNPNERHWRDYNVESSYNDNQETHTFKFLGEVPLLFDTINYDSKGRIISHITDFSYLGNMQRATYTYKDNNELATVDKWLNISPINKLKDASSNPNSASAFNYKQYYNENNDWITEIISNDFVGDTDSTFVTERRTNTGSEIITQIGRDNKYIKNLDKEGRIKSVIGKFCIEGHWYEYHKELFDYDKAGRIIFEEELSELSGSFSYYKTIPSLSGVKKNEYKYNKQGNKIFELNYLWSYNDSIWVKWSKTEYLFSDKNECIEKRIYEYNKAEDYREVLSGIYKYRYQNQKLVEEIFISNDNDTLTNYEKIEYSYPPGGITKNFYEWNNKKWNPDYSETNINTDTIDIKTESMWNENLKIWEVHKKNIVYLVKNQEVGYENYAWDKDKAALIGIKKYMKDVQKTDDSTKTVTTNFVWVKDSLWNLETRKTYIYYYEDSKSKYNNLEIVETLEQYESISKKWVNKWKRVKYDNNDGYLILTNKEDTPLKTGSKYDRKNIYSKWDEKSKSWKEIQTQDSLYREVNNYFTNDFY